MKILGRVSRAAVASTLLLLLAQLALAVPVEVIPTPIADLGDGALASVRALNGGTPVYDNLTYLSGFFFRVYPGEFVGDEIVLAGTEREAVHLDIALYSPDEPLTADLTASLYANDGSYGEPGTLLGTSFLAGVLIDGLIVVPFDFAPPATVPDSLTWVFSYENEDPQGATMGVVMFDPPTIGSSYDDFWYDDGSGWGLAWFGGDPVANFGALLEAQSRQAIPEPATLSLLVLGGFGLLARRRRTR